MCEASGGYEKALARALHKARIKVSVVMAWRVRAFAISQGIIAKNDSIDATVLSRYARNTENLRETTPPRPAVEQLRELMRARDTLVELIKLEPTRAGHAGDTDMIKQLAAERLACFREQKQQIERAIRQRVEKDEQMNSRAQKCRRIKGVGEVTIWMALCELPELGELDKGQPGCLLGVAPLCRQSGKHEGARHIQAGRSRNPGESSTWRR